MLGRFFFIVELPLFVFNVGHAPPNFILKVSEAAFLDELANPIHFVQDISKSNSFGASVESYQPLQDSGSR